MTNKEIAEKVAKIFGWSRGKYPDYFYDNLGIEYDIESWPVTGMMIEHLQGFMWVPMWLGTQFSFYDPRVIEVRSTSQYSIIEFGYHLATAKAFLEAMEIINESK